MFALTRSLVASAPTPGAAEADTTGELAPPKTSQDERRSQLQPHPNAAFSSSSLSARPRPSDPSSSRSGDSSAVASALPSPRSGLSGAGSLVYDGIQGAEPGGRPSVGTDPELAYKYPQSHQHSNLPPLSVPGGSQGQSSSSASSPASGLFKFGGRRKKQQQQQLQLQLQHQEHQHHQQQQQQQQQFSAFPAAPYVPVSPSLTSSNRAMIIDNSMIPPGSDFHPSPIHKTPSSTTSLRTASIFRRPKTADGERRLFSSQPKVQPSTAPKESTSGPPVKDAGRRAGRRLLGPKSASSNALKEQYRKHDTSLPIPVMPQQQSHFPPSSPRTSSSGKRRDFLPALGVDSSRGDDPSSRTNDNISSASSPAQSTFSRLMGFASRPGPSPLLAGLPGAPSSASSSTFGLVPISSRSNPNLATVPSPNQSHSESRSRLNSFSSTHKNNGANSDQEAAPPSPTTTRGAGPAPYPPSSSRWVESSVLETLYDTQDDRTPMGTIRRNSGTKVMGTEDVLSDPQESSNISMYTGGRSMPASRSASISSRYHSERLREGGAERPAGTLGLPAGSIPTPASWTSVGFVNSPLPSPSFSTTEAHAGPLGTAHTSTTTTPSRPLSSTPRHSTTAFPSLSQYVDSHRPDGLPASPPSDRSPSSAVPASGTETNTRTRDKRHPPRAGDGGFMRKRFGSSSSIGLGLGILSPGGNRNNGPGASGSETSLVGTPRTSLSNSGAIGGSQKEGASDVQMASGLGPGRHTSDVGLSSTSRQAAAFAAATVVPSSGAAVGHDLGSRKASFGSSTGAGGASRLAAAGGAAALFGNGNAGGMGSSVLGNTRQRTSSLFASLANPFRSGGEGGSKEAQSPSVVLSPLLRQPPTPARGGAPGPAVAGNVRASTDRPPSRNRTLSAVELDRFSGVGKMERNPSGPLQSGTGQSALQSSSVGYTEEDEASNARQQNKGYPSPLRSETGGPVTAAAAAVDAIKARDTEAQEDLRYFLLGEGQVPVARTDSTKRVLHHSKSEERLGSMLARKSRSSSDFSSPSRARSQSRTRSRDVGDEAQGAQGSAVAGQRLRMRLGFPASESSRSLPVGDMQTSVVAPGDTSEQSDASLQLPSSLDGLQGQPLPTNNPADPNSTSEVEAWAESETPKLLAFLAKKMGRAEIVKFLASTSTLIYPFGAKRSTEAVSTEQDGIPPPRTGLPLEASLATAIRRAALKVYMRRFAFSSDPLDIALRKLLMEIKLPSETQQIDRVMEAFARRYMECNEGLYSTEDQPYIIAFSLMMLHTDAFNRNAKHKMTKADYVKNTAAGGVPTEILEYFYDNTTFTQFIHIDEETDTAVAALPTGGPTAANSAGPSQLTSRNASSVSLVGLGQSSALSMSTANNSDLVLSMIGTGGNPATASFGSLIAGAGVSNPQLVGPNGSTSNSIMLNGPGGKMRIDPYLLIRQGNLHDFRPNLEHLIPQETPYSYAGTAQGLNIGRLRRTFIHAPLLEIVQHRRPSVGAAYSPVWSNNDFMGGSASVVDHLEAVGTIKISKAGILLRKDDIPLAPPIGAAGGDPSKAAKKARGKKWKKWGLVLSGSQALFFKDAIWTAALESQMEEQVGEWWADPDLLPRSVSDFEEDTQGSPSHLGASLNAILRKRSVRISPRVSYFKPDSVVPLSDAIAVRDESYVADGEWVFRLWSRHPALPGSTTGLCTDADGTVWESRHYLLQAASEQEMNDWISLINYSAAYRSIGDRKVDGQDLAKLLCESLPMSPALGPSQDSSRANGLNRTASTLRRQSSANPLMSALSSSTSNVVYSGSRENSIPAPDEPGGYMCSPQATLQTFVAQAQITFEDAAKHLEDELQVARHLAMLTPFQRATRERIEAAAIPVAEKVRERRLQVAKCAARLDILTQDLQHVNHVAPSAMVFIQAARGATGPIVVDSDMPRVSMSEGLRMEAFGSSEAIASDSISIKRVDSTPPQLDMDVIGGGFDTRLDLFGSDRSGPRSSASHGSFAIQNRMSDEPAELGDNRAGRHIITSGSLTQANGQSVESLDAMEELTPTIGYSGEEPEFGGSASSSASALVSEYGLAQVERHGGPQQPLRFPLGTAPGVYDQGEDGNQGTATRRGSFALLPDGAGSRSSPHKGVASTGAFPLSANGPSNSGSGGNGPLSAFNSAFGAMKRKASISRPWAQHE
ncbi:hypothetical protein CF326_g5703 [Tilletia indica]|nr:hypothetical protein CF326_g5703 [Tilletia indica]